MRFRVKKPGNGSTVLTSRLRLIWHSYVFPRATPLKKPAVPS